MLQTGGDFINLTKTKIMNLVEVACYNCGSKEYTCYDIENGYKLVKCSGCGLLYVNPRPSMEDITAAMKTGIHSGESRLQFTGIYHKSKIKDYLRILSDFFPGEKSELSQKRWLDIGCGFGEFLQALNVYFKTNLITRGSEPNEAKAQFARNMNLDVSFVDLDTHVEKYDFISLLNVYSHIPDPVKFLSDLKKNLTPNGEFLIQTGHACHLPVKLLPKPYNLPDHLSFANCELVENICKKLGFEIVKVKIYTDKKSFLSQIVKFVKETAKILLRRRKSFRGLLSRIPPETFFIRCRLIS